MNGGHKAWLIHVPGRLNACPTNAGRSRCPAISRIKEAKGAKNACTSERTTSYRTRWLATRGGIGRERRDPFDGESGARCGGGACGSRQRNGRGGRWAGRRGDEIGRAH